MKSGRRLLPGFSLFPEGWVQLSCFSRFSEGWEQLSFRFHSFFRRLGATFLSASVFFQKADSETGAAFFAAGEAQVFSGCRLDADAVGAATENRSQSLAHQIYAAS